MIQALTVWAQKWGIPPEAIGELAIVSGFAPNITPGATSEAATQTQCRLDAPKLSAHLWRNNSGVLKNDAGTPVRYGLGNESPKICKVRKSSDTIGLLRFTIQQHHVGRTVGVFLSIEFKRPNWTAPTSEEDKAQYNWIQHINFNGGLASFVNHPSQLKTLIESYRL